MKFSPAIKHHLYLSLLLGLWLYLFLVFIAPFDVSPLSFHWRAQTMIGYGVISSLSYFGIALWQEKYLRGRSPGFQKSVFVGLFILLNFTPTYLYYKSGLVLGEYSFWVFLFQIYLATMIILLPLILAGQWAIDKVRKKSNEKITLQGENRLDVLQISYAALLYVQTAQNYVEVFYRSGDTVQKKVMRSTLKKMQADLPELMQVHRSYLVNFDHFTGWADKKSILVGEVQIPVSDKYRTAILERIKKVSQKS